MKKFYKRCEKIFHAIEGKKEVSFYRLRLALREYGDNPYEVLYGFDENNPRYLVADKVDSVISSAREDLEALESDLKNVQYTLASMLLENQITAAKETLDDILKFYEHCLELHITA